MTRAPTTPANEWHLPGWRVLGRIARGGTADVLLAEPHADGPSEATRLQLAARGQGQRVVVKRLYPHLAENEEFVRMFVDEVKLMSRLRSPHIVDVYDLDEDGDSYFAVLELVDGPSASAAQRLQQKQQGTGGIAVAVVAAVCARVARALAAVHAAVDDDGHALGLVHRDVNPQNILIGRDGTVKLGDFGVALSAHGRKAGLLRATDTGTGIVKGKASFHAPEQIRRGVVDVRADLFSLGATAYALAAGRLPFVGASDVLLLEAILHEPAAPLALHPAFDALVMALLNKDPGARPADAIAVADAFAAIHDDAAAIGDFVVGLGLPSLRR